MNATDAATSLVTFGIGGLAVVVAALFIYGNGRVQLALGAPRRAAAIAVVTVAWMALLGTLAASGVLLRFDVRPPPLLGAIAGTLVLSVVFATSKRGAELATNLPLAALVSVQAFRLPLELVMHRAATLGLMPAEMSYGGYNFDIVTGTLAIPVAVLLAMGAAPRWLVVAWNVLGCILLATVVAIAIAGMPMFHAFGARPENAFVAHFPFVWLPGVLVAAALIGHVLVFRRLRLRP